MATPYSSCSAFARFYSVLHIAWFKACAAANPMWVKKIAGRTANKFV